MEAYLAKKWGIGAINTTEPKIVTSAVGSNSATATATLLESGGSDTTLEVFYGISDKGKTTTASPSDYSGLKLWLDAADASTITHSSNAVSQWNDKSGNGNHANQSNSSYQPVLYNSVLNSLPVIRFDGSDDVMTLSGDHTLQTFFLVLNSRDGNNFGDWDWPMGGWTSSGNTKNVHINT